MKITELPPKSAAVKALRRLPSPARRERLRCAEEAFTTLVFAKSLYPDEPAQWFRVERVLRGILRDSNAKHEWIVEARASRRRKGGRRE